MATKKTEIEDFILKLLKEVPSVSVRSIARARGISDLTETERRAIRRALGSLEERRLVSPVGTGPARAYVLTGTKQEGKAAVEREKAVGLPVDKDASFHGIELTSAAADLLKHVSQPLAAREPVGYNPDFLISYEPNRTFYLTQIQRELLRSVGRVEMIERPAGTYARNILNRLLIDLSWNSSRLEGNTYSLLETKRLIEVGEAATGKDATEAQMILNHKAAIEYIVELADEGRVTTQAIRSVHALLSEDLMGDPAASGRLRSLIVGIGGSTYMPLENPQMIQECFDLLAEKLDAIADPFEQSLFSIVQLSYLQAFEDVNKRTARIVANIPLVRENLKPLSFTDVDETAYARSLLGVYERNDISLIRDLYVWAYTRSAQRYSAVQRSIGEPNRLKLKYRDSVREIVASVIVEKVRGDELVPRIRELMKEQNIPDADVDELFTLIETEIISLHEGNVVRYRVTPSQFQAWKDLQTWHK